MLSVYSVNDSVSPSSTTQKSPEEPKRQRGGPPEAVAVIKEGFLQEVPPAGLRSLIPLYMLGAEARARIL